MKVGIIELMETGHIVLAETLCRIFCSMQSNSVVLFTLEDHAENLNFLKNRYSNLSIVVKPDCQKEEHFLESLQKLSFDRIYVVTLNRHFRAFARWKPSARLFLVTHNLDEWFGISPLQNIRRFSCTLYGNKGMKQLIYSAKLHFIYPGYKRAILRTVRQTKGKIVVLSQAVKRQFEKLSTGFKSEVVPFSVFDAVDTVIRKDPAAPLRICIPGILSQYRRDYLGLLDLLENSLENYKERFIIDFLGGVQNDNPLNETGLLLKKISELKQEGFKLIVHNERFIPPKIYEKELAAADIILGNMNVVLNKYSEYGRTKETGLPFAMIKAAKPGILPSDYPVPEEISTSVLTYKDYPELGKIILSLINDRAMILNLQEKATGNSKNFTPERIYSILAAEPD